MVRRCVYYAQCRQSNAGTSALCQCKAPQCFRFLALRPRRDISLTGNLEITSSSKHIILGNSVPSRLSHSFLTEVLV